MQPLPNRIDAASRAVLWVLTLGTSACGGGGSAFSGAMSQAPIMIVLPISTVVVSPSGTPVTVSIQIDSTSETAIVSVGGLPAGVQVTYAASDTNPSGTLTFGANASAPPGNYVPIVTVISAGQTASLAFALTVSKP